MTKEEKDGRVSRRSCVLRRLFLGITAAAFGLPGSLYAVEFESARDSAAAAFNSPPVLSSAAEFAAPVAAHGPALSPSVKGARDYASGSGLVMLQGFHWYADDYWYKPPRGWWGVLSGKAAEVAAAGFGLVWFPPVSAGSYYPREWYNLDSQWGKKAALTEAVDAMHSAGVKVLADIVLNHRNGSTNWLDFKNPDWPSDTIVNDDEVWAQPPYANLPRSRFGDEGQGDFGARDLDHRNPKVQEDAKAFLRWLRKDIGFDGWRYDMVKGYPARYVQLYNAASAPEFSVGEYYDGNRRLVTDWIDGTGSAPDKADASAAFDFPTRYALVGAVETERYELLADNGRPSGVIGWWPARAVTFVENHDTSPRDPGFILSAPAEYRTQRLMAYAYILTHPGIPCVFWPHFFDWGRDYRDSLTKLISIRKAAGISSDSPVSIVSAGGGLYAAVINGRNRQVAVKLGRSWGWTPGEGWNLAASGERYAVWLK